MNLKIATISPLKFFALTYVLSWSIWIVLMVASAYVSEGLITILRLFGVLMPAASAVILTFLSSGRPGEGQLFARFKIWRFGAKWWLLAILVYPIILVLSGILYNLYDAQSTLNILPISIGNIIANAIFLSIASVGEEVGWRGVALPALQNKFSPFKSSLILGLLWSAWHLPFWLLIGTLSQFGSVYFAMNFLFIVPTTFFVTWIFNNTKGSLLLPTVFHVVFNVVNVAVFPVTGSVGAFGIFIVMQFVVMLAIIPALLRQG